MLLLFSAGGWGVDGEFSWWKHGGGTILSFEPEKELVISALAPDRFPTVRATRTRRGFV